MEEYQRKEKELEREKAEELGEGETEKEDEEDKKKDEEKKKTTRVLRPIVAMTVSAKRGRGRPRKATIDNAETDVEGDFEGENITERGKMVRFLYFLFCDIFINIVLCPSAFDVEG